MAKQKKEMTLAEYSKLKGQLAVSKALGITQGMLSRVINSDRVVYVVENADGSIAATEHRAFPYSALAGRQKDRRFPE